MSGNDIKVSDVSFIEIYDDFVKMRNTLKFSAAIMELAEKYNKSEITISRMMTKLQEYLIINTSSNYENALRFTEN